MKWPCNIIGLKKRGEHGPSCLRVINNMTTIYISGAAQAEMRAWPWEQDTVNQLVHCYTYCSILQNSYSSIAS